MSHKLLDNVTHKNTKVVTALHEKYGDNKGITHIFPAEFGQLQADFPLLLKKNSKDEFEFIALMGFEKDENLFLEEGHWSANSIPWTIERGPFLIGFEMQMDDGVPVQTPVVHIDTDHPRVQNELGEPLFLEHGGQSDYLQRINSILLAIYQGHQHAQVFLNLLEQHQLLEPLEINITFNNGEKTHLTGLYTVNEEKVTALTNEHIAQFHQSGMLSPLYMMLASLPNIKKMVDVKNNRLRTKPL